MFQRLSATCAQWGSMLTIGTLIGFMTLIPMRVTAAELPAVVDSARPTDRC